MAEEEEKGGGMVKDMGGAAVAPLPGIETYRRLAGAAYGLERGGIEEEGAMEGGGGRGAEEVATEDGGGRGGACEAPLLAVGGGIVNAGVEAAGVDDAGDVSLFSSLLLVLVLLGLLLLTAVGVEDWSTDSLLAEEAIESEASSEESAEEEEGGGGAGVEDCWALLASSSVLISVFTVAEDTKGDGGGTQDARLGGRAGYEEEELELP